MHIWGKFFVLENKQEVYIKFFTRISFCALWWWYIHVFKWSTLQLLNNGMWTHTHTYSLSLIFDFMQISFIKKIKEEKLESKNSFIYFISLEEIELDSDDYLLYIFFKMFKREEDMYVRMTAECHTSAWKIVNERKILFKYYSIYFIKLFCPYYFKFYI